MAFGMASPAIDQQHRDEPNRYRTLQDYRELMRQNVEQGLLDIMLMSVSSSEVLTINERLFENSPTTPAIRANDATDIWMAAGGAYRDVPSQPFRTTTIDHAMYGKTCPAEDEPVCGADLGLYSVTFNNQVDADAWSLNAYSDFRFEAELRGFRHFLEVFSPNCLQSPIDDLGRYTNDCIARTLAGVAECGRPIFLKIVYHGPAAMEQLVQYDSSLIVGILGGVSGTTFDAFHQLWEAKKYGARVALYGRMINNCEHQLSFIQHLRWLADGEVTDPAEAVRSYHGALQELKIEPFLALDDDLKQTLTP